jgi:hypothetical protein
VSKWSRKRLFVKWDLMVEGLLRLAEKTFQGQNNGRKSPFMMRSSSKSQGNKEKSYVPSRLYACQSGLGSKRLFVSGI